MRGATFYHSRSTPFSGKCQLLLHNGQQFFMPERFFYKRISACGGPKVCHMRRSGYDDHRYILRSLLGFQKAAHIQAIYPGQLFVQDIQVGNRGRPIQYRLWGRKHGNIVASPLQNEHKGILNPRVVVRYQYFLSHT